jgi:3-oxoacyl-[acyl-carrier protein] reductase
MREPTSGRRVALITGTRKGIGKYLAEHMIESGYLVEGCSREAPDWTLEGYTHHLCDVAEEDAVKRMVRCIQKTRGRLDVAINNAGIASMNHSLLTPTSTLDRIMSVNFRGTFLVCREAAKLMQQQRYGRIVNLGTVALPMKLEGEAMYAASKGAVVAFTQILAYELGCFGITCNVVGPTPIETDLIRNVPKHKIDAIIQRMAVKRLGRMEDVSNAVDFFISPKSDFVTGQVIYLGGL